MKYILILLFFVSTYVNCQKPDFIIEVFRHGARAPQNITYDSKNWQQYQAGELTPAGMRMHYILGESLAQNYSDILFPFNPNTIYARSTNFNRTIMSAYSQLYGIYQNIGQNYSTSIPQQNYLPPYEEEYLNLVYDDVNPDDGFLPHFIQPVPVHVLESSDEILLFNGPQTCPNSQAWENSRMNDSNSNLIWNYLVDNNFVDYYNSHGCPINSLMDVWLLGDTLVSNYFANYSLPCQIEYQDANYNASIFAYQWFTNYVFVGTDRELDVFSTNLLYNIYDWFDGYANGNGSLTSIFLSGHDTTLLTVLGAFNLTYPDCLYHNYLNMTTVDSNYTLNQNCIYPTFASHLTFEFFNQSQPYIIFTFNGVGMPICGSDSNNCSLAQFQEYIKNATHGYDPKDFSDVCGINSEKAPESENYQTVCIILGAILFLEFGCVVVLFIKKRQQQQQQNNDYSKHENTESP